MAKLVWDDIGEHLYETGVRMGVLYLLDEDDGDYPEGVAWNGLTTVTESPSRAEANAIYADDSKYLELRAAEEFEFSSADEMLYPGLAYRTVVGNDVAAEDYGYKIHLIYGCKASPSERSYQTINDSPEAITFSWELTTVPVNVEGYRPTANVIIDSTKFTSDDEKAALAKFEAILYGVSEDDFSALKTYKVGDTCTHSDTAYVCIEDIETAGAWDATKWESIAAADLGPRLPLPDEVKTLLTVT